MNFKDLAEFIRSKGNNPDETLLQKLETVEQDLPETLTLRTVENALTGLNLSEMQLIRLHREAILMCMKESIVAGMFFACTRESIQAKRKKDTKDSEFGVILAGGR